MTHYIAIVEDAGRDSAAGVWFPELPGCFSAGDDLDEALKNAPEALALYLEETEKWPTPRSLRDLKADPQIASDLKDYLFALIEVPISAAVA